MADNVHTVLTVDRKTLVLLMLVLAAVAYDVFEHMRSPAYRFYKSESARLERRYLDFEHRVKSDFVPAILSAASNRVQVIDSFVSNTVSSNVVSPRLSIPLDGARFFCCGGVPYIEYDGHWFTLGDYLYDDYIVFISPLSCRTANGGLYVFRSPSFSDSRQMEVLTNVHR